MGTDRRPLRVLWLVKGLGPGGAERLLLSTARVADRQEVRFEVAYVRPDKNQLVGPLRSAGVPARCVGDGPAWPARLRRLLVEGRYDVVHAHSPLPAGVVRLVAATLPAARRPLLVSTEHNEWPSFSLPTMLLNGLTAGMDDHRWAVSERVRASMWRPARGAEVLVHGLGPDDARPTPDSRTRVRAELGISEESVVACTVANLRREKDYWTLLQAAARATAATSRLRWLAVGQGPLAEQVRAWHDDLRLGDRLLLLGYRPDVPDVLAASDLFVLSSAHEGLPVALMEALAAGLPVVATDVGGLRESLRDGVDGLLVPPHDPSALADAVVRLVHDDRGRLVMSANARAAAERFDIRGAVRRQVQVYADLVLEREA
jgi:glycosyltransferase involved in cell wall biosynthesis